LGQLKEYGWRFRDLSDALIKRKVQFSWQKSKCCGHYSGSDTIATLNANCERNLHDGISTTAKESTHTAYFLTAKLPS